MLKRCVNVMDDAGSVVPISEELRAKLEETVTSLASTGLRTLALTMRDMDESMAEGSSNYWENPPDEQLTLCCIVAIKVSVLRIIAASFSQPPFSRASDQSMLRSSSSAASFSNTWESGTVEPAGRQGSY